MKSAAFTAGFSPATVYPIAALLLLLLLPVAYGNELESPLYTICSGSGNYTAGGPFGHNLGSLLGSLVVTTPPTGFALASAGGAYGLALCRGDVPGAACKACVRDAGSQIRRRCPSQRRAVIWYDSCLVRYSDEDFFGAVDEADRFYMWNLQSVPDPSAFDGKVAALMGRVAAEAGARPRLFATGVAEAGADGKLYGLAQCTRDLAGEDCLGCLRRAVAELPTFAAGKRGGRVVGASCNIRYELYTFFRG